VFAGSALALSTSLSIQLSYSLAGAQAPVGQRNALPAVPPGELRAAGDIAEVNGIGSGGVVGGFFKSEFEVGTGDEVYVDVYDGSPGGGRGSVGRLTEARMGAGFRVLGKAMAVVG
jgi:hypothetical protein